MELCGAVRNLRGQQAVDGKAVSVEAIGLRGLSEPPALESHVRRALADALVLAEEKAGALGEELETLRRAQRPEIRVPPLAWVKERVATLQEVLERRTERSALLLRKVLGHIRLEPVKPDIGRTYFRAVSKLQPLALLEMDEGLSPSPYPSPQGGEGNSEAGSNPFRWWRRRESNPRPKTRRRETLQA